MIETYSQTSQRSPIPEDDHRNLFDTLYESLVWANQEQREAAVKAVIAIYALKVA